MKTNELLRQLRKLLAANENGMAEVLQLGNLTAPASEVLAWLKQENEAGFLPCPDTVIAHCLEGIIIQKRGPKEGAQAQVIDGPVDNNQVLKKLRIAFELHDDEMHEIFHAAEAPRTKQALNALFRKPGHRNFLVCDDATLRQFLQGLSARLREH